MSIGEGKLEIQKGSHLRSVEGKVAPPAPEVSPAIYQDPRTSYELDALKQLQANILQLDELQSKLGFVMKEVGGIVARKR